MSKKVPEQQSKEELYQLSKEELVEVIQVLQYEIARIRSKSFFVEKMETKPNLTQIRENFRKPIAVT